MPKNIFVIGFDNFNYALLEPIGKKKNYRFHSLLATNEVKRQKHYFPENLLSKAEERLKQFSGSIDAIVGYWDFPTTCLVPFLNKKMGLPGPSLQSVLKCEHKYWSRVEQSQVTQDIPKFCVFNPHDKDVRSKINLAYPFWIKPVKSFASHLGFRIHNDKEFKESIAIIREGIGRFSTPFNYFLNQITRPQSVADINGEFCIAESIISGRQCTLEGYVYHGQVEIYGVIDSIREPNRSTFSRYQYPSHLPQRIQQRMISEAQKVMNHLQYDNAPFNIEFFYEERHDHIWLLEINPRISQSHCDIFRKVDGASHHEVMIDLALGDQPDFPKRKGNFHCAAKFFFRTHHNGVLKQVPGQEQIQRVKKRFPDALINIHVKEGMRPSDLQSQESYSYELGYVCMGADNEHALLDNHRQCLEILKFEFQ
ncbi:ATP-grasp domain-containing protein [Nitrosomonas cryotolerans]|uniref:ATP-grasp domain-containing protein n=1 Tax=Nitrosomonas cryotolerans ATCC 49181 TaxID=1131553 RepID=A0A1N6FWT3_9PROT|nr:ATP-grasp domain-containing protein [Nitrosomonas cryotolerans]SFP92201.1 ATP-grasp domain-containing protein [Nitrosomonas cryotolerans]SIN99650.1 ATP-grasp domain-containing protein [Nitrosomonas cryotolerans ATCC 49181]